MMKNKKGWLKILEAFIAIVMIGGFLAFIYSSQIKRGDKSGDMYNLEETLLNEVRVDSQLRRKVLENNETAIEIHFEKRIPSGFNYTVKICNTTDVCGLSEYRKNIYARSKIISANLEKYDPKKLRLFIWSK